MEGIQEGLGRFGNRIVERRKERTGKWWGRRKEIRAEKGKKEGKKVHEEKEGGSRREREGRKRERKVKEERKGEKDCTDKKEKNYCKTYGAISEATSVS
jgi:hypothetical protein